MIADEIKKIQASILKSCINIFIQINSHILKSYKIQATSLKNIKNTNINNVTLNININFNNLH